MVDVTKVDLEASYIIWSGSGLYWVKDGSTGMVSSSGSDYITLKNVLTGSLIGSLYDKVTHNFEGYLNGVLQLQFSFTGSSVSGSTLLGQTATITNISGSDIRSPTATITNVNVTNITGSTATFIGSFYTSGSSLISGSLHITNNLTSSGSTSLNGPLWVGGGISTSYEISGSTISGSEIYSDKGLRKPCKYLIYKVGSYYYCENGETGKIVYGGSGNAGGINGANFSLVLQAAANNSGSIVITDGTYSYGTAVNIYSYTSIEGSYATILTPTADVQAFIITAPATRITIKNIQIQDNSLVTSTKEAIYLNNTSGVISLSSFENIIIYYYAFGMRTPEISSNLANSLISCTFKTVSANDYRSQGFVLYSFFDCRFIDMIATSYNNVATEAYRFQNADDSGTMLTMITALGDSGISGSGIVFNDVANIYGSNFVADTFNEGLHFANMADYIALSNVEVRSSADQGVYCYHDEGRVSITNLIALDNTDYGVRNFGITGSSTSGSITVLGGKFSNNSAGAYSLTGSDKLAYVDGASDFP